MKVNLKAMVRDGWVALAMRLFLGGVFITAGVIKLSHLRTFATLVAKYPILPTPLAQLYGYLAPGVEVVVGALLILGFLPRFTLMTSLLLIASFIVANGYSLITGLPADECGCFGKVMPLSHAQAMSLDIAMLLMATTLVVGVIRKPR